ncbi:RluA family pseudouridine synthase [bacterium]|nr:RluA family pseudouridine synthase [bacterium]
MNPNTTDLPEIIWEDSWCCVCLKPPNIPTVMGHDPRKESLATHLITLRPECGASTTDPRDGGFCHRLDRETSGVLVAAKTRESYEHLRGQFSKGTVQKHYLALVEETELEEGRLSHYLYGRHRRSQKVSVATEERPRSRKAELFFSHKPCDIPGASLLSINLITGLRHQIRAQLAAVGAPLIGDALYGSSQKLSDFPITASPVRGEERSFLLHAERLSFLHPETEEPLSFHAPLPI